MGHIEKAQSAVPTTSSHPQTIYRAYTEGYPIQPMRLKIDQVNAKCSESESMYPLHEV